MDGKNNNNLAAQSIAELGKRIAEVAISVGGKKALSKQASISESQLYRYISGQSQPTALPLAAIAQAGRVNLDWLITGNPSSEITSGVKGVEELIEIPYYADSNTPSQTPPTSMGRFIFRTKWLFENKLNPGSLRLLHVYGDAMETTICDGDLLIIDIGQKEIIGEAIFVLKIEGYLIVKRLQHAIEGGIYIASDNPHYREQYVPKAEIHQLQIIGRAVWSAGKI